MKFLIDSFTKTGTLHHGYSIEGPAEQILQSLFDFFENNVDIRTRGNPDFWLGRHETFSVDDARALRDFQKNKSFSAGRKIIVISFDSITHEAQNSLLKVFEEPAGDTHFFLIIRSPRILLTTVRSRLIHIIFSPDTDWKKEHIQNGRLFINLSLAERLEYLKDIIEEKDKVRARKLLTALEVFLATDSIEKHATKLKEIILLGSYLDDRSPSLKLILEHLALVV